MIKFFQNLLDAIFPEGITCNICGCELRDGDDRHVSLCPTCMSTLNKLNEDKTVLPVCDVYSLYRYETTVQKIILHQKDDNMPHLTKTSARLMARYFRERELKADVVCYVPCSKAAIRRRDYDHMEYIAWEFSEQTGIPICYDLVRNKQSSDQATISARDRFINVRGAFGLCGNSARGKRVVLLDDIVTTGATISECVRVLKQASPAEVIGLTFAKPSAK